MTVGAAIIGQEDSGHVLEELDRGNLFVVPLDDRRAWLRYHQLLADVLQARLIEEQTNQVSELHRRASHWFEQNDLPAEAIEHALLATLQEIDAASLAQIESQLDQKARATSVVIHSLDHHLPSGSLLPS